MVGVAAARRRLDREIGLRIQPDILQPVGDRNGELFADIAAEAFDRDFLDLDRTGRARRVDAFDGQHLGQSDIRAGQCQPRYRKQ